MNQELVFLIAFGLVGVFALVGLYALAWARYMRQGWVSLALLTLLAPVPMVAWWMFLPMIKRARRRSQRGWRIP